MRPRLRPSVPAPHSPLPQPRPPPLRRIFLGQSREHEIFPIHLCVTKISQGGQDAFMGVIRSAEGADDREARLYASGTGTVISVSKGFTSMTGYSTQDLGGRPVTAVFPDQPAVAELLGAARLSGDASLVTKFGEEVAVALTTALCGTEDVRLVALTVKGTRHNAAAVVVSTKGVVQHANHAAEALLGVQTGSLVGRYLHELFAEPFSAIYGARSKETQDRDPAAAEAPGWASRLAGRGVLFRTRAGTALAATLAVRRAASVDGAAALEVVEIQPATRGECLYRPCRAWALARGAWRVGGQSVGPMTKRERGRACRGMTTRSPHECAFYACVEWP